MSKEITINYNEVDCLKSGKLTNGVCRKLLQEQGNRKTILLRFPKGYKIGNHTHKEKEEHIILKGECEIDGILYGPGSYRFIPAGTYHTSFIVKTDLVLFVIWEFE